MLWGRLMQRPGQMAGSLKGSSAGAFGICAWISPLPFCKESPSLTWAKCHKSGVYCLKCQLEQKYIQNISLTLLLFPLKSKIFISPRRQQTWMLKDYCIIHWWLSEGISKLLSMHSNWFKPKETWFLFFFFWGFFLLVKFYLVLVKLPSLYTHAHILKEILLECGLLICSVQSNQLSGHREDCLWHCLSLTFQTISKWNVK